MRIFLAGSLLALLQQLGMTPANLNTCGDRDAGTCRHEWRRCIANCPSDGSMPTQACLSWCSTVHKQCREYVGCSDTW